jgi:hypothetical protein
MTKKVLMLLAMSLSIHSICFSQMDEDVGGIDFTYVGKGKTDNKEEISFSNYKLQFSIPMMLKNKNYFMMHYLSYGKSKIHYGIPINTEAKIDDFHSMSYTLGFMKPIKNNWEMMISVGASVNSNFDSGLKAREIKPNAMLMFSKLIKENMRLNLGLMYEPGGGFNFPMPMAGIEWYPTEKWNINLGIPEIGVNYKLSQNSTIGTSLFMAGNEFTLSKKYTINNSKRRADKLNYMDVGAGLQFKQRFLKNFQFKVNTGYTFYRNLQFKKGTSELYEMKADNNYFINAGVSFLID